jgi:hypothetical protein
MSHIDYAYMCEYILDRSYTHTHTHIDVHAYARTHTLVMQ